MELAPLDWERGFELLSAQDQVQIGEKLNAVVQRAAFLGEYMEQRQAGSGHKEAVRRANTKRRRVRQAMGYSYPAQGEYHI